MKRLIYLITAMLAAVSCVYPFTADISSVNTDSIVIEGDIIIGGSSHFKMSEMLAIEGESNLQPQNIPATFTVEDDKGGTYQADADGNLDLTSAPSDRRYRLRAVNHNSSKEYVSSWQTIMETCEIDSLSFMPNESNGTLDLRISLHGPDDYRLYQFIMDEVWEYKAFYRATHYYVEPSSSLPLDYRNSGMIVPFENGENTYYCWKRRNVPTLNVISTEDLSENRLVNEKIHAVPNYDNKLSYIYCLNVSAMAISQEHLSYLKHLNEVSHYTGSLFSPNPSEMRGNIRCVSDTTEFVLGYIGAGKLSSSRVFYYNDKVHFFKPVYEAHSSKIIAKRDWYRSWKFDGLLPMNGDPVQGYEWAESRCIDCRLMGGNKEKPEYWPNNHN